MTNQCFFPFRTQEDQDYLLAKALQESEREEAQRRQSKVDRKIEFFSRHRSYKDSFHSLVVGNKK